jgi:hypothetical protein
LSARAGELDCVEVRVLSVDQPTVTGVGAARRRELERTAAKTDAKRFIVSLRIAVTNHRDVATTSLDALRVIWSSSPV